MEQAEEPLESQKKAVYYHSIKTLSTQNTIPLVYGPMIVYYPAYPEKARVLHVNRISKSKRRVKLEIYSALLLK